MWCVKMKNKGKVSLFYASSASESDKYQKMFKNGINLTFYNLFGSYLEVFAAYDRKLRIDMISEFPNDYHLILSIYFCV